MRLFFIITLFTVVGCAKSQQPHREIISEQEIQYPSKDTSDYGEITCYIPEEASVDLEKWKTYLNDSLVLDDASLDTIPPGRYTVFVQFEVGEKGKLCNISILKEPGYGLGERVKKVISTCIGIWNPVIAENGQIAPNYRKQPLTFVIEESCEELSAGFML